MESKFSRKILKYLQKVYPNPCRRKKLEVIKFATAKVKEEWNSGDLDERLKVLVCAAAFYCWTEFKKPLMITCIYRDDGVHGDWRGVDARVSYYDALKRDIVWYLSEDQAMQLEKWISDHFTYDPDREFQTAFYHKNRGSKGWHLHFQTWVSAFQAWV
jgi:hypothetical protein